MKKLILDIILLVAYIAVWSLLYFVHTPYERLQTLALYLLNGLALGYFLTNFVRNAEDLRRKDKDKKKQSI
jgi:hypothetical protein